MMMRYLFAFFYDLLLSFGILFVATGLALFFHHGKAFGADDAYLWLYLWFVLGLYFTASWHRRGQTLGLVTWRLKVVDHHQALLSYSKAWLRYVLATLSLLLLGAGFYFAFFNRQKRYWHDWVLNTHIQEARGGLPGTELAC